MDSRFTFGGKNYIVSSEAYEKGGPIVLPDNTILDVGMWGEVSPPAPLQLSMRDQQNLGFSPEETAKSVEGTLARDAST